MENLFNQVPYAKNLISSVIAVLFIYLASRIFKSGLINKQDDINERLLFSKKVNRYTKIICILVVFLLWFSQLQGVFVSLLAVAAALVLAFKEMIMCVTGGFLLKSSSIFKVGDRIEVNKVRGFVFEKGLMTTKVLEIGPEATSQQTTGDVISIPNSIVYTHMVKNESFIREFSIKSFFFKVNDRSEYKKVEEFLRVTANTICEDYLAIAQESIHSFCLKEGIVIPSVSPRTKVVIENNYDVKILLKMPVENRKIAEIEQELNRKFLDWIILNQLEEDSKSS